MSIERLVEEHAEFEIKESILRGRLQEEAHQIRADVSQKLGHLSWAIYRVTDQETSPTSIASRPDKEVLILHMDSMLRSKIIDGHKIPIIRMVSNEPYLVQPDNEKDDDPVDWLTIDFSLDYLDRAAIHIDSLTHEEEENDIEPDGHDDGVVQSEEHQTISLSPHFWVTSTGSLGFHRLFPYAPTGVSELELEDGTLSEIAPFNINDHNLHDQLYAIAVGRRILEQIGSIEPVYTSSSF